MTEFSKSFIQKIKKDLRAEKDKLQKQMRELEKYPDQGSSDDDNAMEFEQFEGQMSLDRKLRNLPKEIDRALGKIETGKYGICERHKGPIEKGRLEIYPAARYCSNCASKISAR